MIKKRLIGVVTVKDGLAVQSFGYQRYLPLGKPECLVRNLDRWGADEILIQVIDRSSRGLGPDIDLLSRLSKSGLGTPLIYNGGIKSVADGIRAVQAGADRLALDAAFRDCPDIIHGLSEHLGSQAIIAAMPMTNCEGKILWRDYRNHIDDDVPGYMVELAKNRVFSEILVIDWLNEGRALGFQESLLVSDIARFLPLIAFGGISEADQMAKILANPYVFAIASGNFLSYREHAIQLLKSKLCGSPIRQPIYDGTESEAAGHG